MQNASRQTKIQRTSETFWRIFARLATQRITINAIKHITENHTVSTLFSFWSNSIVPFMRSTYDLNSNFCATQMKSSHIEPVVMIVPADALRISPYAR